MGVLEEGFVSVKLREVLGGVDVIEVGGRTDIEIKGVACDSRQVCGDYLFAAIRGQKSDGRDFVGEAVRRGAVAIMCEGPIVPVERATVIKVSATRRALAQAAANFHANPSNSVGLVGITGTNGKTTVCHLARDILEMGGWPAGMIGTIEYRVGGEVIAAERTTPGPVVLNSLLAMMRERGIRYAVMEVSSHSLDQERVWGLDFDVAAFTNFSGEHLDYHRTKRNYLRAKALLFERLSPVQKNGFPRWGVVCIDQPEGRYITSRTRAPVLTYGLDRRAEVTAENVRLDSGGACFVARTPWGPIEIKSRLLGRHNVSNVLGAVGIGLCQGVGVEVVRRAVGESPRIPGRMEIIPSGKGFGVVVDYAHTDDALEKALEALREITKGRLIVVFGCGGDRDRGKRRRMGKVAWRLADVAVVTSDNPRSEEPMEIISEVVRGFGGGGCGLMVEPDRRAAIAAAVSMAKDGDTVLVAGKGHETYQEFKDYRIDFDDRKVARELLA